MTKVTKRPRVELNCGAIFEIERKPWTDLLPTSCIMHAGHGEECEAPPGGEQQRYQHVLAFSTKRTLIIMVDCFIGVVLQQPES